MLRHVAALATIALLATACEAGTDDGAAASPTPGATPATSPAASPSPTAPTGPASPSPSPAVALTQTCAADAYTVSYPEGWNVNGGTVIPPCRIFHPGEIVLEEGTEPGFHYAAYLSLEEVPYERVVQGSNGQVTIDRRDTTVDGRDAFVVEERATEDSPLVPPGTIVYRYAVDAPDGTLTASTYSIGEVPFEQEKQVLDAMLAALEFSSP